MEKLIKAILFLLFAAHLCAADGLYIKKYDKSNYPIINADVYHFKNGDNLPVESISKSDLKILDNNTEIDIDKITPIQRILKKNIELVIFFDLAMAETNREFSDSLLSALTTTIDTSFIKFKVIGFDQINIPYFQFSKDTHLISEIIWKADYSPYSDLDLLHSFPKFNTASLFSENVVNKSVLLITDNNKDFKHLELQLQIQENKIEFNTIYLNELANTSLNFLEANTPDYFQINVKTERNPKLLIQIAIANIMGYKQNTVSWKSAVDCDAHHSSTISYAFDNSIYSSFDYTIADSSKPYIRISPDSLRFSNITPGTKITEDLTITAVGGDLHLYDIYLDNYFGDAFVLDGAISSDDVLLREGEQYPLRIHFSPIDSAVVFTRLKINSSSCRMNEFEVIGGFPNVPPKNKTLEMKYPNECGDFFIIGEKALVKWTGVMPNDVIQLEYSLDNGEKWDTLAKNRINLEYEWELPKIETDLGLIRVKQLWPNNVGKTIAFKHNAGLRHAVFNNDGSLIATAGIDSVVTVWDSNTGQKLKEFKGHTGNITNIDFSDNNKHLLSSSNSTRDFTTIIWNLNEEKEEDYIFRELKAHTNFLFSSKYSHNSARIITTSRDGRYIIWSASTGDILVDKKNSGRVYTFGTFSEDGRYYALGAFPGICEIYQTADNNLVSSFDLRGGKTGKGNVDYITFSPDGKELLIIYPLLEKSCIVWDIDAGELKFDFQHLDDNGEAKDILHASYFWDNDVRYILTAGADNRVIQWDGFTGDSIVSFIGEHSEAVTSAYYNFDGSRILTASADFTAKIWNLDNSDVQMDTSDCVFKIVKVDAIAKDISLGEELIKQRKDTVITDYLINQSTVPFQISSLEIIGKNREEFELLSASQFVLDTGSNYDLHIAFKPKKLGIREAEIQIKFPAKTIKYKITANSLDKQFLVNTKLIDFGDIDREDIIKILSEKIITNKLSQDVVFDSVYISHPNISNFNFGINNKLNQLKANADKDINLMFVPNETQSYTAVLSFRHKNRSEIEKILLLGKGVEQVIDTISIKLSDIEVKTGDIAHCDIEYTKLSSLDLNKANKNFTLFLRINNSILEPQFEYKSLKMTGTSSEIEIEVEIKDLSKTKQVLGTLDFKVSLGNQENSKIEVYDISAKAKLKINSADANVKITNLCYEGGVRLFETNGVFRLEQTTPNPAISSTTLEYEIIEKGNSKLYIMNELGKTVRTLFDYNMSPGIYQIQIDLNGLSPGLYYYILETPNMRSANSLLVQ